MVAVVVTEMSQGTFVTDVTGEMERSRLTDILDQRTINFRATGISTWYPRKRSLWVVGAG